MTKSQQPEDQSAEKSEKPTRIMEAAQRAVRAAVREHKLLGNPIAGRRNGKVVVIPPEEIEI